MASTLLMSKDERKLYRVLLNQMKRHLDLADLNGDDVVNAFGVGEVNTTLLAEEIAYDSPAIDDPDDALGDETHIIWGAAVDAAEWFEANYR